MNSTLLASFSNHTQADLLCRNLRVRFSGDFPMITFEVRESENLFKVWCSFKAPFSPLEGRDLELVKSFCAGAYYVLTDFAGR